MATNHVFGLVLICMFKVQQRFQIQSMHHQEKVMMIWIKEVTNSTAFNTFWKIPYGKWSNGSLKISKTDLFNSVSLFIRLISWRNFRPSIPCLTRVLDPFRTGFVTKEEFFSIIKDIEERLTDTDLAEIAVAFGTASFEACQHFTEVLKPWAWFESNKRYKPRWSR